MHRGNAQGLACLGSKKSEEAPRSRYVGAMEVDFETCEWRWCSSGEGADSRACGGRGDDTNDSIASTVAFSGDSHEDGGDDLVRFNNFVQQWMECSVLMPSSQCLGLATPAAWTVWASGESSSPEEEEEPSAPFLAAALRRIQLLDDAVTRVVSPSKTAVAVRSRPHLPLAAAQAGQNINNQQQQLLWKKLLFEGRGLQWFRDAMGGTEAVQRMFANAYLNIQSISKPSEVSEAAAKKGSPPWALVQVAESDACICCLSLMRVPFAGFKRHSRNGVVFCFFGSRVFVSCMDEECRGILRRRSKAFFCLVWHCCSMRRCFCDACAKAGKN